jgi:hypothetical protein
VDVARALLDGVEQDRVDEADDGGVLGGLLELEDVDVLVSTVKSMSSSPNSAMTSSYGGRRSSALDGADDRAVSEATTGSTLRPVRNLMSSIAWRFVGSAIATISEEPEREIGMHLCFSQTSLETSLMTSGSISYSSRLTAGTRYCAERKFVISLSEM